MPVSSSTEHWIRPDALKINLNHFGDPDYLQVSLLAGAVVMAFKQDVISYNAAHNYRTWPLQAANTYLETSSAYHVYARLTRSEVNASALVVYDPVLRDIEGRSITIKETEQKKVQSRTISDEETDEEESPDMPEGSTPSDPSNPNKPEQGDTEILGEPDPNYFYVYLGKISASVDEYGYTNLRTWEAEFRAGSLNTNQFQNEEGLGEWSKMFKWNKVTDLIEVLKIFSSAIFKKFSIKKGDEEKVITDIKRSTDSDDEFLLDDKGEKILDEEGNPIKNSVYVPVSDETSPTSAWVRKNFLSKVKDDRSKGMVSSDKGFEVGKFVAGASGAVIQIDKESGHSVAELDKLYVRMKAYFETLEIVNVNSVGGKMILSPAGAMRCVAVQDREVVTDEQGNETVTIWDYYRCYFLAEQDGEKVENRFKEGDQAYSQMFNAKTGVQNKVSNKFYWRLVVGASVDAVEVEGKMYHYIDLSKTDCADGSDEPSADDVINHRGSRMDNDRQNFIEFSSVGVNAPYITLFQGVNSYDLTGKEYVQFGYNQANGRAFMNVYGDMYVGGRDGKSYMRYTPENGLEVCGKLVVGTTYDGKELGGLLQKQQEDLESFANAVTKEFENIRNEMDGAIDTWFGEEVPTLENYPAIDWSTDSDKDSHLGDLFYTNDGKAFRFQHRDSEGYYWAAIEDSEVIKALELAQKALDTADGKRRVFVTQPYPPYDLGDLWAGGADKSLMRCVKARESGSYYESDWALADNSQAYADAIKQELVEQIGNTKNELDEAIKDAEEAAKDYTDEGKKALQAAIDEMEAAKADIDEVYTKAQADGKISDAEARALVGAQKVADAAKALAVEVSNAYADGEISKEEAARIQQAQANLEAAKKYADDAIKEAFDELSETIEGYEYLKTALGNVSPTEINQGLVLTSLIQLRNEKDVIMAGANATTPNGDKSIAFWAGGSMLDRENGGNVANAADFLIRMDGSGYAAGGNLSWDVNGKVTADPLSFFVGEEAVAHLLRAFMVSEDNTGKVALITPNAPFKELTINNFLKIGSSKISQSKEDVIYIDANVVVRGGVTMYGSEGSSVPSILDSLPTASTSSKGIASFDASHFVVTNGHVSLINGAGGLDETKLGQYLSGNGYLTQTSGDGRYLKLSGGELSGILKTTSRIRINGSLFEFNDSNGSNGVYLGLATLIGLTNKNLAVYIGSAWHELIHSGNIGSQSVSYATSSGRIEGGTFSDANGVLYTDKALRWFSGISSSALNIPTFNGYQNGLLAFPLHSTGATAQLYISANKNPWFRGTQTSEWKEIAFVTDNVASATKLSDDSSFTAWGQTFFVNGKPKSVNGLMSNVSGVLFNGNYGIWNGFSYTGALSENDIAYNAGKHYFTGSVGIGTPSPSATLDVNGTLNVSGVATLGSTLSINGVVLSKSSDGVLYLDGNLVVRGGVVMYGTDGSSVPSIMESIDKASYSTKGIASFDSSHFLVENGHVSLINGAGGLDETKLGQYLSGNGYLTQTSGDGRYLKLSGGELSGILKTTSRIRINGSLFEFNDSNGSNGVYLGLATLIGLTNKNLAVYIGSAWHELIHSGNIGSQSVSYATSSGRIEGGTFSDANGVLYTDKALRWFSGISSSALNIPTFNGYQNGLLAFPLHSTGATAQLYISANKNPWFRGTQTSEWKEIAFVTDNVASATKLSDDSSFTAWGQTFFVNGKPKSVNGLMSNVSGVLFNGNYGIWNGFSYTGALSENDIAYNAGKHYFTGSVGIGTPSPSAKLDVNGTLNVSGDATFGGTLGGAYWGILNNSSNPYLKFIEGGKTWYIQAYQQKMYLGLGIAKSLSVDLSGNTSIVGWLSVTDIHGNGNNLYLGNSGNNAYVVVREDMKASTGNWIIKTSGEAAFGATSASSLSVSGSSTLASVSASSLSVSGSSTLASVSASSLNVAGLSTLQGDVRLQSGSDYYGSYLYFGDGVNCYIAELSDDVMTLYGRAGISLNADDGYMVKVNSNLLVSGGITMYSQRSLKDIVDRRGLSLVELQTIVPTRYTWKDKRDERVHIGGIADEVMEVLPEVVYKTDDGVLTMDYGNAAFAIAASLIEPMNEHERRICELERENRELKREIEQIKMS